MVGELLKIFSGDENESPISSKKTSLLRRKTKDQNNGSFISQSPTFNSKEYKKRKQEEMLENLEKSNNSTALDYLVGLHQLEMETENSPSKKSLHLKEVEEVLEFNETTPRLHQEKIAQKPKEKQQSAKKSPLRSKSKKAKTKTPKKSKSVPKKKVKRMASYGPQNMEKRIIRRKKSIKDLKLKKIREENSGRKKLKSYRFKNDMDTKWAGETVRVSMLDSKELLAYYGDVLTKGRRDLIEHRKNNPATSHIK